MFDRERSEEETERDGRRDRCQREKIIAPGREATIRVALSPPSVEQPHRHIWIVVNSLACDRAQDSKG